MNGQQTRLMFSRKNQDWATPEGLYNRLNDIFHFTYDPCPSNKPVMREIDGFSDAPERSEIWANFPYDYRTLPKWIDWGFDQVKRGSNLALLLPVRTNTKWWQEKLQPLGPVIIRDPWYAFKQGLSVWFIPRKLRFGGYENEAPFASMIFFIRLELATAPTTKATTSSEGENR